MIWLVGAVLLTVLSLVGWLITGILTYKRACSRGGDRRHWFFYGLALGPFGLYLIKQIGRSCPACSFTLLREARQCPQCGKSIPRMKSEENPADPFWSYRQNWSAPENDKEK